MGLLQTGVINIPNSYSLAKKVGGGGKAERLNNLCIHLNPQATQNQILPLSCQQRTERPAQGPAATTRSPEQVPEAQPLPAQPGGPKPVTTPLHGSGFSSVKHRVTGAPISQGAAVWIGGDQFPASRRARCKWDPRPSFLHGQEEVTTPRTHHSRPPHPQVLLLRIQPTARRKYRRKKLHLCCPRTDSLFSPSLSKHRVTTQLRHRTRHRRSPRDDFE